MDLKLGNLLAITYLDGQFDFAVTSFALHHISDEQKLLALDEMRRVVKPHGTICITDLMFENEMKKDLYLHHLNENGKTDLLDVIQNEYVSLFPSVLICCIGLYPIRSSNSIISS